MDNRIPYDILLDREIGILRYLGNMVGLLNKYIRQKWLEKGISIDYKNIQGESNLDKNTNSIARYVKKLHIDHMDGLCLENIQLFPNMDNINIKFRYKYPGGDNISSINSIVAMIPLTCSINIIIPPENMDRFFDTSGSFIFGGITKTRWLRTTMVANKYWKECPSSYLVTISP